MAFRKDTYSLNDRSKVFFFVRKHINHISYKDFADSLEKLLLLNGFLLLREKDEFIKGNVKLIVFFKKTQKLLLILVFSNELDIILKRSGIR
jgi:hypothetical protein